MELIDGEGFHIPLLKGLDGEEIEHPNKWTTMDEIFSTIMFYADQSNKTKIYAEPEYEDELTIWVSEVHQRQGFHQYQPEGQSTPGKTGTRNKVTINI